MRRGLIVWNPEEITVEALDTRLVRLRQAMADAGLDAMILYTNFVRPAAVAYLSSFSPYWADAILLVPKEGRPVFATSMSTRMNSWIKTVNPVGEIVNTRRPGLHVGEWLKSRDDVRRVGVLEMDGLPAGIYGDLETAAAGVEFVEAGSVFAEIRRHVDDTEHRLLSVSDALASDALAGLDASARTAGAIVGRIEQLARLGGAEEAYIALAPDLADDLRFARLSGDHPVGTSFAVRASVAYKGSWVRRTRTFSSDPAIATRLARLDAWFADLLAGLDPSQPFSEQIGAAAKALGGDLVSMLVESCVGTYPLQATDDAKPRAGASYVVSLGLAIDGLSWIGAAPVLVGRPLHREEHARRVA